MQSIAPLSIDDFKTKANVVIAKVEIDIDGNGDYRELPDVTNFSINTNIENKVSRFCAYSFSLSCLNTDNRFSPLRSDSNYFNWVKQGRRIKIYAGIEEVIPKCQFDISKFDESVFDADVTQEHYFQHILGRIDNYSLRRKGKDNICSINGRDLMRVLLDYKLYATEAYWGTIQIESTVDGQTNYNMNTDCKGIYLVYLDSIDPYNGEHLSEIYRQTEWGYIEEDNEFVFLAGAIPSFTGENNLKIYYFRTENVEEMVADILLEAGILADAGERTTWLASDYVTPTAYSLNRAWVKIGTSALEAIRLVAEVVQYRFYFDFAGNPVFKPKGSYTWGIEVDTFEDSSMVTENIEENIDEVYNHIIVIGEARIILGTT